MEAGLRAGCVQLLLDDKPCAFGRSGERQRNSHPVIDGKTGTDLFCAHWVLPWAVFVENGVQQSVRASVFLTLSAHFEKYLSNKSY
jgi:hypothetical protein